MIVVIADDFTGAAELGGIGLRYNLKVEVNTRVNLQSKADLLVIAMDTRSMPRHQALLDMEKVTEDIVKLNPTLIFKKVDSVLRGYVAEELLILIQKLTHSRALLVPANPNLGRTIVDGEYWLNAEPLHLSNFSIDPEFPIKTSNVTELLQGKGIQIHSQKHTETLKYEGIIVGDAIDGHDLKAWAETVNRNMIIAGAAGFFTALLDRIVIPDEHTTLVPARELQKPALIISGTAFKKSSDEIWELKNEGYPVSYMPLEIIQSNTFDEQMFGAWCTEIVKYITTFGKAIIAINPANTASKTDQARPLREKTAIVVNMVFKQTNVHELLIEGGSTASAILTPLAVSKLFPVQELAPGVVRMHTEDNSELYITIKPGSYAWPESIRNFMLS